MSILINMEMPESCSDCFLDYDSIVCMALNKEFPDRSSDDGFYAYCSGRMSDCPLIEVPPHGDLVDRDALKLDFLNRGIEGIQTDDFSELQQTIDDAPTIIPADN